MSPFDAAGEQWRMLEGSLLMSRKERKRLAVLAQVKSGELKLVTAGEVMGVTYRQAKRVWRRYRVEGDAGLVHRSRGRPSPRRKPVALRRRGQRPRAWRERKACYGMMVQLDGSHHDWFEGRRGKAVLMVMVDDATNEVWAQFFEEETTRGQL